MESSEEGTTRFPLHSDGAGLSEHRARSQLGHRLLPGPAGEWVLGRTVTPGLGGCMCRQAHTGHVVGAGHMPKGGGSLLGVQSEFLLRMFSPSHLGSCGNQTRVGVLQPSCFFLQNEVAL